MRVAALDLGSNTSLLLVAEVENGRIARVISDATTVTKLGQGVHQAKSFHPDALERVKLALERYRTVIDQAKVDKIKAVATSAARDVTNQAALEKICVDLDIPLEIISGDREARMTFEGAISDEVESDNLAVIDVGGGSTELILNHTNELLEVSVNVGSVRLTDLFVTGHPIATTDLKNATSYATDKFKQGVKVLKGLKAGRVIGVAGTPTTLAALEWNEPFSETKVHRFKLTASMVDKWIEILAPLTLKEREQFRGLQPQRADVIVMGSVCLREAMRALQCSELTVSIRGLRYGLALEMAR
jgi:exopolyphosphatase/guanosine-5'-triphosphate,3'-diphosphate pyrophosphatase